MGFSAPGCVTGDMVRAMAKDPIVFACANPTPEIFPEEALAAGARVVGSGRSDYANQINNVLAFPGIFRGALDVRAREINDGMKVAAARALADLTPPPRRSCGRTILSPRLLTRRWPRLWRPRWPRRPGTQAWPGFEEGCKAAGGLGTGGAAFVPGPVPVVRAGCGPWGFSLHGLRACACGAEAAAFPAGKGRAVLGG